MSKNREYAADLAVCEGATPGPWKARNYREEEGIWIDCYAFIRGKAQGGTLAKAHTWGYGKSSPEANAQFIALARTALPWYIKRVMELEKALKQASKEQSFMLHHGRD